MRLKICYNNECFAGGLFEKENNIAANAETHSEFEQAKACIPAWLRFGLGKIRRRQNLDRESPQSRHLCHGRGSRHTGRESRFRQQLLEIRLNDVALKYCNEKNAAPITVKVVRVRVTGAKDGEHGFVPVYAEDALTDGKLQQTKFYMGAENVPGLIKVFVFEADAEKMKDNAAAYQEELNKEFNNTPKIEKALRRELWRHVLLERCRQKGLITADLAGLDIIQIIQVHDAFVKSGLLEELIEEREAYLQKNDLNQIDDKFLLYKRAIRDRIVKPEKDEVSGSELALMADCVQDLFNARADSDYMSGRIKTVMFCRRPGFAAEKARPAFLTLSCGFVPSTTSAEKQLIFCSNRAKKTIFRKAPSKRSNSLTATCLPGATKKP